ncbi:MAG: cytochrome c biogenesis protein CcdA [Candidatus Tectomicrobia bacterium]|uniref:Cytochrome c biogenesis protein CcdA n=1 Tax=Tectimicrobiota bacterium TaxID=2528274 RepID=A0A932M1Q7_UNCTE|nr:cytochrome c biogenesis protein CcdA [Candidatus Tectomicrobia bacterium]
MENLGQITVLMALSAGVFSFLSPCVLPLFPSYLSFISGVSLDQMLAPSDRTQVRKRVVFNSLCFILGFSLVFVALGASVTLLGQLLLRHQVVLRKAGGILIVIFGLYLTGVLKLPFLARYRQFNLEKKPSGYLGSFLVGCTFSIGWTPCVGPILGSILLVASTSEDISRGITLLLFYSAGLALPFFVGSLSIERFLPLFQRYRKLIPVLHTVAGLMLIAVGVLLYTNYLTRLNSYALQLTPRWLWERL